MSSQGDQQKSTTSGASSTVPDGIGFFDVFQRELRQNFNQYGEAFRHEYYDRQSNFNEISPLRYLTLTYILLLLIIHVFIYTLTPLKYTIFGSLPWLMAIFMVIIAFLIPIANIMFPTDNVKQKNMKIAIVGIALFIAIGGIVLITMRIREENFVSGSGERNQKTTEGFSSTTITNTTIDTSNLQRSGINIISANGKNYFDEDGLPAATIRGMFESMRNHVQETHSTGRITLGQILGQDTTDSAPYLTPDLLAIGREKLTASHFWICSSYKTAMPENKRSGIVSAEAIYQSILLGARFVWLDVIKRERIVNKPIPGDSAGRTERILEGEPVVGAGIEYQDGMIQSRNTISLRNAFTAIRQGRLQLPGDDSTFVPVKRRRDPIFIFLALRANNDVNIEKKIAENIRELFQSLLLPEVNREMQTSFSSVPLVNMLGRVIFIADRVPTTPELAYYINFVACGKNIIEHPNVDAATYNSRVNCDFITSGEKQGNTRLTLVNETNFPMSNMRTTSNNYQGTNDITIVIPNSENQTLDSQTMMMRGASIVAIPLVGESAGFATSTRTYFSPLFDQNTNIIDRRNLMKNSVTGKPWSFSQSSFVPKRNMRISTNNSEVELFMYRRPQQTIIPSAAPQNPQVNLANATLAI